MKMVLVTLLLCIVNYSFSQGPPPALEATSDNKKLIIELMEVTNYESYFVDYCMKKIETIGAEKKLNSDQILKFKNKISFDQFMDHTVFNQFAVYSTDELKEMIALCKKLNANKKNYSDTFFSNAGLQSNLELQIKIYMAE